MRKLVFLLVISLFCLPVLANQEDKEVLPFPYMTWDETDYSIHIMDAFSGEILHELDTENQDCATYLFSENNTFLFTESIPTANQRYSIFNMETNEIREVAEGYLGVIAVSETGDIAYRHGEALYIYDADTEENVFVYPLSRSIATARFSENDFNFVVGVDNDFYFHRWNNGEQVIKEYEGHSFDWRHFSISPDGRYLTVVYSLIESPSLAYLIDTNIDTFYELPELYAHSGGRIAWLPGAEAQFVWQNPEGDVMLYHVDSHESEKLLDVGLSTTYDYYTWSPDGDWLVLSHRLGLDTYSSYTQIELLNMETREVEILIPIQSISSRLRWLSAEQLVYSDSIDSDSNADLYYYDLSTGEKRQLTNNPDIDELVY